MRRSRLCLQWSQRDGSKCDLFKFGTNGPCVYTRTVGTVSFSERYPCSSGAAEETFVFKSVPFFSSVDGQNHMEWSQKRTDMKMKEDFFVCFLMSRANYRIKLDFCD